MKRDLELIRRILVAAEECGPMERVQGIEGTDNLIFAAHLVLLEDAGLAEVLVRKNHVGVPAVGMVLRLTMAGHEFVEAARNESIWKSVGKRVSAAAGLWTVAFIAEMLKGEVKKRLGLGEGGP